MSQPTPPKGSLPGQRGIQHFGLTVPDLEEAVSFFCEVLGCEPFFELGTFAFDDDWMHEHLNVHPRAVIRNFQMLRCGNGTNLEVFEYSAPDQADTWTPRWPSSGNAASASSASPRPLPRGQARA